MNKDSFVLKCSKIAMPTFFYKCFPLLLITISLIGCGDDGPSILSTDETSKAGELIEAANLDLKKIKVLYTDNEGKRHEITNALSTDNVEEVRRISGEVVDLINEGTNYGNEAINKIRDAREMKINPTFNEYLRLKEESLLKQLEAFSTFHTAARILRDNYDPKDANARARVKTEFEELADKYRDLMEKARSNSVDANDLYKETVAKERG